jgi:hypothetical protein
LVERHERLSSTRPRTISSQFKSGMMSENVLGFDEVNMSQSIVTHTTGNLPVAADLRVHRFLQRKARPRWTLRTPAAPRPSSKATCSPLLACLQR